MLIEPYGITLWDSTGAGNLNVNTFDRLSHKKILSVSRLDRFLQRAADIVFPVGADGKRHLVSLAQPCFTFNTYQILTFRHHTYRAVSGSAKSLSRIISRSSVWRTCHFMQKIGMPAKAWEGGKMPTRLLPQRVARDICG